MIKKSILSLSVVIALFALTVTACKSGSESGGSDKIAVGSSCEGIGSMEARFFCDGRKTLFCSSFTKYVYKVQNECSEGQVCELMAGGKGTRCVAAK